MICEGERIYAYMSHYLDNHTDTTMILPGYEGSWMEYRLELYRKHKYCQMIHTLLVSKNVKSSLQISEMALDNNYNNTVPVQH